MEIEQKDGVWRVTGDITESMDVSHIKIVDGSKTVFDLSGVRTINSCGVREWLAWINKRNIRPIYQNCSQAVVMQFNMVSEFLDHGAQVASFQIPAYCSNCDEHKIFTLFSGKDFHPGKAVNFEFPPCKTPDCHIDPDVDLEIYCYFVEELKE